MCNTSNDFTVSLDYVSHFLSIHKAELFFNALAGGGMRNPFFGKVTLKDFYLQFYFPFCNSKGQIC